MADTQKSDLKERLVQGAIEGIGTEIVLNAIVPGAGLATNTLRTAKGLKKAAKVAGKGAAKEGLKVLDGEDEAQNQIEELGSDLAIELLTRTRGR